MLENFYKFSNSVISFLKAELQYYALALIILVETVI